MQESRRDLHDIAAKHTAWEKKEKKKAVKTRTTVEQPLWCVIISIICATHTSLSDHALIHRYIWEDELVDYVGQVEQEAVMATKDPEKKKKAAKKDAKKAKKDATASSSSSSSTKPTTTTRKPRLAITFDEG